MVLAPPVVLPLDWSPSAGELGAPRQSSRPAEPGSAGPAQSDVPERSIRKLSPTAPPVSETWTRRWPRPSRLLAQPAAVEAVALLPDQPPVAFGWRGARGALDFQKILEFEPDSGTTNVRNTSSSHWRPHLSPASRCLVPFTAFSEPGRDAAGKYSWSRTPRLPEGR